MKSSKTFNKSYLQERKMEERGPKELMITLECLNYKKSSQQLPSVFHRYERLAVLQNFFAIQFCFEQEKTLKNFSKKLYTVKIKKKKEEAETKSSANQGT